MYLKLVCLVATWPLMYVFVIKWVMVVCAVGGVGGGVVSSGGFCVGVSVGEDSAVVRVRCWVWMVAVVSSLGIGVA